MKHNWLIDVIIAVTAVAALAVWLVAFPPTADTPVTAPNPAPTEPSDPDTPAALSFTGMVLELDGDSALMDCYDKSKFDTVWVNVSATDITPQVGEEYTVVYEDLVMPSLPPRITAVKMLTKSWISTGEALYNDVVGAVMSAFPWDNTGAESYAIPDYPEMSYMYRYCESLSDIGWFQVDLDGNGQKELLIGNAVSCIYPYDVFTIKDGQLMHLFSGHDRNSYYLLEDGYIKHQWSSGAMLSGSDFYRMVDGELQFIERITMDLHYAQQIGLVGSEPTNGDADKCFFRSQVYNSGDEQKGYVSITVKEATERIEKYSEYEEVEINYIPLQ